MYKKRFYVSTIILFIVVFMTIVFAISDYNRTLEDNLYDATNKSLDEIINQQVNSLRLDIKSDLKSLENYAYIIGVSNDTADELVTIFDDIIDNTNFESLIIVDDKGQGINSNGQFIDVSHREYFKEAMLNGSTISAPLMSQFRDVVGVPLAAPIYDVSGNKTGALIGVYTVDQLNSLLLPTYHGDGRTHIVSSDGELIGSTMSDISFGQYNFYDYLESDYIDNNRVLVDKVLKNIENYQGGNFITQLDGVDVYIRYEPLGISDWYVVLVVQSAVIADNANAIRQSTLTFMGIVVLIFIGYFAYIFYILKRNNSDLYKMAYFDNLTGLPNMQSFREHMAKILGNHHDKEYSCIIFDLSNFKYINDFYGYEAGNRVLRVIAKSLIEDTKSMSPKTYAISRIYADTFAIFVPSDGSEQRKLAIQNDVFDSEMEFLGNYKFALVIGRYKCRFGENVDDIFEKTTIAHMKAQTLMPNQIVDYEDQLRENIKLKTDIRNKLEQSLVDEEFVVYLQPKVDFEAFKIVSFEALIRWYTDGKILSPAVFIDELERSGLIVALDFYVFEQVCKIINQCIEDDLDVKPIAVNFSRRHLADHDFAEKLYDILSKYQVSSKNVVIEFTETTTIESYQLMIKTIDDLHRFGFKVSMDDFGSGYSSFGSLDQIHVDELKLDIGLIRNIAISRRSKSIVHSIILMAKSLDISLVAEGVETKEQVAILQSMRCDSAQGYYFYKPMIYSDAIKLLDKKQ